MMRPHFTPTEITLKEISGSNFKELVAKDLTFVDADRFEWNAPKGTWTDGASVPRLALAITDGRFEEMFLKAAVVHDAYCQKENEDRCPPYRSRPWREVHEMFYHACRTGGTPRVRALIMFGAVLWFGPRWDDPEGEDRQVPSDLAQVGFSGSQQWIKKERPKLGEIEEDVAERERIIQQVHRYQSDAMMAVVSGKLGSIAALDAAESLISAGLKKSPDDLMFLNLKGHQHSCRAQLSQSLDLPQSLKNWEEELNEAERFFKKVIEIEPRDPSALNGLGNVEVFRGELDLAEVLFMEALSHDPYYQAAQHSLVQVRMMQAHPEHAVGGWAGIHSGFDTGQR